MGKPFGFGCMKLHIDCLLETDVQSLYSVDGLCSAPGDDRTELVDHYIEAYDRFAAENLKIKEPKKCPSVRSRNEILDFLYLHRIIQPTEKAGYMTLDEYKNVRMPLPSIQGFRQNAEEESAEKSSGNDASSSMDDLLAQLAAKYKRH